MIYVLIRIIYHSRKMEISIQGHSHKVDWELGCPTHPTGFWPSVMTHTKLMHCEDILILKLGTVHCDYVYIMLLLGEKGQKTHLDTE